jgi:hypothetical protein
MDSSEVPLKVPLDLLAPQEIETATKEKEAVTASNLTSKREESEEGGSEEGVVGGLTRNDDGKYGDDSSGNADGGDDVDDDDEFTFALDRVRLLNEASSKKKKGTSGNGFNGDNRHNDETSGRAVVSTGTGQEGARKEDGDGRATRENGDAPPTNPSPLDEPAEGTSEALKPSAPTLAFLVRHGDGATEFAFEPPPSAAVLGVVSM